ncbi:MAG: GPW/gp25 family protein [Paracoccus sp. (in: a-proteobacteria)]|uniref:GPW/gp25 family protein n=1 Tax=Paracoccus sp. TaxID=267 RepID=UPI0026DEE396|nr:GPW/gp25 family protein [Paracoccus sp. (in: a-proteobacteria)]MDO5631138.1 GPW/gp25 family protein [Paracoccus sp. (in: a-proteobacteria)]
MDRHTGRRLDGWPHIRQSIIDLLTTRIGTRVMRRDYGSEAPNLVDRPSSAETVLDRFVAIAEALDQWEPRVELTGFGLVSARADGQTVIGISLRDRSSGELRQVEVTA